MKSIKLKMMNTLNNKIYLFFILVICLQSCDKDLGNYDYKEINEIDITGIAASYMVRTGIDTLKISPEYASSFNIKDENRYEIYWVARNILRTEDTIGRVLSLNYKVQLSPGNYNLYLHVYDKETKIRWIKSVPMEVGTALSRGIMLVGDDEQNNVDVDMITMSGDTSIARGLISGSGLPALQGAIGIQFTPGLLDVTNKLWLMTQSGSYYLERTSFKGNLDNNFEKLVFSNMDLSAADFQPVLIAPSMNSINGTLPDLFQSSRVILTQTGQIFGPNVIENAGDFYTNPINVDADNPEVLLPAAPYLFYSPRSSSSMIWYDKSNERFMLIPSYISTFSSRKLSDGGSDEFSWNQVATGRSLVYGENSVNSDGGASFGNSFALMKDKQKKLFLYKFYVSGAASSKKGYYPIKMDIAADLDRATHYAFSSFRSLLFYVVDGKLYAYDYNPGNERLYNLTPTGADPITMIKFDTEMYPNNNSLYIGSYNASTKGTLQRFTLGANPNSVELAPVVKEKWSNLVKIKNMSWRAKN